MASPRVVSLLPSATEIVAELGVGEWLVGRSHECDQPAEPWLHALPVLTAQRTSPDAPAAEIDAQVRAAMAQHQALYTLDEGRLADLRPDVILTQDLCHVCSIDLAAVQRVAARLSPQPKVVSLNPHTLEAVLDDHLTVGAALGIPDRARRAVAALRERLYTLGDFVNPFDDGPNVAFLEWTDPLFVGGHWTPQLIERAGGRHPLNATQPVAGSGAAAGPIGLTERQAGKSVTVPPEVLAASRPEVLIIAPCGLALPRALAEARALLRHPWFVDLPAVRSGRIAVVDGNRMFNRPGPRLVDAFAFLVGYLQNRPEIIPANFPWTPLHP